MGDGIRQSKLNRPTQASLIEHFTGGTVANCASALVGLNKTKTVQYYQPYY